MTATSPTLPGARRQCSRVTSPARRHVGKPGGNRPEARACWQRLPSDQPGGKPDTSATGRKPGNASRVTAGSPTLPGARRQRLPSDQPGGKPDTSATGRKPGNARVTAGSPTLPGARRQRLPSDQPGGKPDTSATGRKPGNASRVTAGSPTLPGARRQCSRVTSPARRHVGKPGGNRPEALACRQRLPSDQPGGKPDTSATGRKPGNASRVTAGSPTLPGARRQRLPSDQPGGKPDTSATGRKPGNASRVTAGSPTLPGARRQCSRVTSPARRHVGKPGCKSTGMPGPRRQRLPSDQPGGKPDTSATGRKPGNASRVTAGSPTLPGARRQRLPSDQPGGKPDTSATAGSPAGGGGRPVPGTSATLAERPARRQARQGQAENQAITRIMLAAQPAAMAQLRVMAVVDPVPFPAVRIGKPHIDAPTGKVVRTHALVTNSELQNSRPVCYRGTVRPLRQVENRAPVSRMYSSSRLRNRHSRPSFLPRPFDKWRSPFPRNHSG